MIAKIKICILLCVLTANIALAQSAEDTTAAERQSTYYIGISGGGSFFKNAVSDSLEVFQTAHPGSPVLGLSFIKEFHNNILFEVGASYQVYKEGVRFNQEKLNTPVLNFAVESFGALQLNVGSGYNLKIKQKHIANLHAGLAGVLTFNKYDDVSMTGVRYRNAEGVVQDMEGDSVGYFFYIAEKKMDAFPLIYIGISHNLELAPNIYLVPSYRYHAGFMNVVEFDYYYWAKDIGFSDFESYIDGSYHTVQVALKFSIPHPKESKSRANPPTPPF